MFDESSLFESAAPWAVVLAIAVYLVLLAAGTVTALVLAFRLSSKQAPWSKRIDDLLRRPWMWRDAGRILLFLLALIAGTIAAQLLLRSDDHARLLLIQGLGVHGLALCGIAFYMARRGYRWSDAFGMSRSDAGINIGKGATAYLGLFPLVFISSAIYQGILSSKGWPPQLQDVVLLLTQDHPLWLQIYILVLAVVLAPVVEEVFFRGIVTPLFCRRFGTGAGVCAASLLFATIHFHVPSMVPLFVLATGLSMAYIYTGTLWASIAMHALFNGMNLGIMMILRHSSGGG